MAEIEQVADRVSVLRRGKVVSSSSVSGISTQELIGLMMGTDEVAVAQRRTSKQLVGNPILALNGVGVNIEMGGLSEVSLDVHPGEIVGIAGVSGNGQAELVRVLSGTLAIDKGSIVVEGNTLGKQSSITHACGRGHAGRGSTCIGSARIASDGESCSGLH